MSSEAYAARLREERRSPIGRGPKHDAGIRAKIRRLKAQEGLTNRELAARFGLGPETIGRILRGNWE